jgi:Ni/Co efflux regulator RcnB
MNKAFAALLIGTTLVAGAPVTALAAPHGHGGGSHGSWNGGGSRGSWNHGGSARSYGGGYRVGGVFPHYSNNRYWIQDYRAYRLPPPRYGYRYYRDDNGDIVMAAIASGLIGLVVGSELNDRGYPPAYGYGYPPPQPYYGYPPPRPYPYYRW